MLHNEAACDINNYSFHNSRVRLQISRFVISLLPMQRFVMCHYNDVIMSVIASQITSLTIVHSTVYSGVDRKHQSSASLAFVWGIHRDRWIPRTNGQLRGKCFHLMTSSCILRRIYDAVIMLIIQNWFEFSFNSQCWDAQAGLLCIFKQWFSMTRQHKEPGYQQSFPNIPVNSIVIYCSLMIIWVVEYPNWF